MPSIVDRLARISRRDVLKRTLAMGASVPAVASLLAACGGDDDDDNDDDEEGGDTG
jgi:hypothetical protein